MADVFDNLGYQPDAKLQARFDKVRGKSGLRRKLTKDTRKRLRGEFKSLSKKIDPMDASGLRMSELDAQAKGDTRSRYGEARDSLVQQIAGQQQRQADLPVWNQQYRDHVASIANTQRQQAIANAQQLRDQATAANTADQAQQKTLETNAAGNPFAAEALQASKNAAASRATFTEQAATGIKNRGDTFAALQDAHGANSRLEEQRQMAVAGSNITSLEKQKKNLSGQIVDYFNNRKSGIRSDLLDAKLKSAAAQLAAGNTAADNARLDHASSRADTLAQSQLEKDKYQRDNSLGPYKPPAAPKAKSKGGVTPDKRRANKQKYRDLTTEAKRLKAENPGLTAQQIATTLRSGATDNAGKKIYNGQTKDSFMAQVAATKGAFNGVTRKQKARAAKEYGIYLKYSPEAEAAAKKAKTGW